MDRACKLLAVFVKYTRIGENGCPTDPIDACFDYYARSDRDGLEVGERFDLFERHVIAFILTVVGELHDTGFIHQNVAGFEVAVDHALLVRVMNRALP